MGLGSKIFDTLFGGCVRSRTKKDDDGEANKEQFSDSSPSEHHRTEDRLVAVVDDWRSRELQPRNIMKEEEEDPKESVITEETPSDDEIDGIEEQVEKKTSDDHEEKPKSGTGPSED
ncbi:putative methyltransferase PMT26-like protein [Corchorus olitorius]|uniref:Methyltransferase PMT26-like protein n=1 Tax=Corchorus olitorius TaxID=93759 RepID=A0A1R3G1U9_9ROSI|nr:putative methyltransferase PMT26-like protein [Corchorus olitorius]